MKKQFIVIMILIFICALLFGTVLADAANNTGKKEQPELYKYYTSIMIESGDTLWGLAEIYAKDSKSYNVYIEEVKRMNGLQGNQIRVGQNLLIFYYSEELK